MSYGDIHDVILKGYYDLNRSQVINVFHYVETGAVPVSFDEAALASTFAGTVVPDLLAITHNVVKYYEVEAVKRTGTENVGVSGVYTFSGATGTGLIEGDAMGPESAFAVKFPRPSNLFRHNYKRFCGVPENYQNKGVLTLPAGTWDTLKARLLAELVVNANATFAPAMVRKTVGGQTLAAVRWSIITNAVLSPNISTQNTRKVGRGA